MAPVLLLLLLISLPRPDLSAASVISRFYFPKEEDPSSGVISYVHVDKTVDIHDVNSGSFSGGEVISGSHSESSGYDGVEKESIPSGQPSPDVKGSGPSGYDEKQHISGDAVTEFSHEHSGRESTTPVELVVEMVSGDYLTTRTSEEKKTKERVLRETNEVIDSDSLGSVSGVLPESSESTQETLGARHAAPSTETTRHRVSSGDTAGDYRVSVQHNVSAENSEVTPTLYHSGQGISELDTDKTSEGEGSPATISDEQELISSFDRISTVTIVSSTHESSGTDSAVPSFTESVETDGQETSEKLTYEPTESTHTIHKEKHYTSTAVEEAKYTTRTTLRTSTPNSGHSSSPRGPSSENKTEDVKITSDRKELISVATQGENQLSYFTTNYNTQDSRSRSFETTQQQTDEEATLSLDNLTTRDEAFATADNDRPLEYTLTDFTKFTKQTSDFSSWLRSQRTRRQTHSTDADGYVTTTSDPNYVTHIVTSDTSRVVSSPGVEGSKTAATAMTPRNHTKTTKAPATEDSYPPETMYDTPEATTKAPATTTTKPTTTTTITTTTTTARPKPKQLGDPCSLGEVCGNNTGSGCINNTCACKENYFAYLAKFCVREPYNLTVTAGDTYLQVYWQGESSDHNVSVASFDDNGEKKTMTNLASWPSPINISSLKPGSMLLVSVRLSHGGNSVSSNITLIPSAPTIQRNESNNTCIRFTWSKGSGYVDEYFVTILDTDQQSKNRTTISEQWTECDLVPGLRYVFSVQAVRNSMRSYLASLSVFTKPSTPVNASSKPGSKPHCVEISWRAGEGEAENFVVKSINRVFSEVKVSFNVSLERYSTEVCHLTPGSRYNYTIESAVSGSQLLSSPAQITACTAPSKISRMNVLSKDATSVTLQWSSPVIGKVDGYRLQVVGENRYYPQNVGLQAEYRFPGLQPGTRYNFTIASLFCGLTSDVTTLSEVTEVGALTDVLVMPNGTRLEISWTTPNELLQSGAFHITLEVLSAQSQNTVISKNVTESPQTVETNRSGECFAVRLTVAKGRPRSRKPFEILNFTDEAAPGGVRDLEAKRLTDDRTVMNVTWSAPNVTNGVIQKYDVIVTGQRGLVTANRTLLCQGDCTLSCSGSGGGWMSKREASTIHFQRTETQFTVRVDYLSPYENYDVRVVAYTSAGQGQPSDFVTTDQLPAAVTSFKAEASNSSCIRLQWNYPKNANDTAVTRFVIQHIKVDWNNDRNLTKNIINTTQTDRLVCELDYWTDYEFNITAFNQEGEGEVATGRGKTGEHTPDRVENLTVSPESDVNKPRIITVQWHKPIHTYGIIVEYIIVVRDSSRSIVESQKVFPPTNEQTEYSKEVQGLSAETDYVVEVFGTTSAGGGPAEETRARIPAGVLPQPSERVSAVSLLKGVEEGSSTATIHLPISLLCKRDYGQPEEAGFIVGRDKWTPLREATKGSRLKVYQSWRAVDHSSDTAAYFVRLDVQRECRQANGSFIRVLVGIDKDCPDVQGSTAITCNGRLLPETDYRFQGVYCTRAACTYSEVSEVYRTDRALVTESGSDTAGVAAGVSVAFLIIFLGSGAAFYFVRRHKRSRNQPDPEERVMEPEIPRNRPVKLASFAQHVEQLHRDSNLGFSEEYKLLKDISREYTTRAADLPACKAKNRYTNILPWDHSRVKLLPTDDEEGSDYTNANYLPGDKHRREFIAAQGPLPATVDDFWRMVWENKVAVIVMLTQCVEKGKVKCEKYWPEEGESVYHGDLCVQVRSQSVLPDYIIRVIDITLGNHTRMIKHFHFMRWPDHGCPERPAMLLSFVSAVRAHMPHSGSGPTLVHCSAGVGRTGTFIALDQLLQQIRRQSEVDIFALVLNMRDHRIHMVQTENQYIYIHDCLVDALCTDTDEEESEESEEEEEHIYGNC